MKVKSSSTAIKYCRDKKISASEFHEKFDKDLELMTEKDNEGTKLVPIDLDDKVNLDLSIF